jgi:hypothetical protein
MARIRSIHPGYFTDEDVVSVSMAARMLLLGLGVEADDKGVFPWKPSTIKMRVFPADLIDVVPLLDELLDVGLIMRFESDGKSYGAIRNFRKHQRPKTPNDIYPAPPNIRNYVGLTDVISEIKGDKEHPFPPKGEKPIQMEDGGGKEGGKGRKPSGFPTREARKKTGFVKVRTAVDAAHSIIERLEQRYEQAGQDSDGQTLGDDVQLLPAVISSGR